MRQGEWKYEHRFWREDSKLAGSSHTRTHYIPQRGGSRDHAPDGPGLSIQRALQRLYVEEILNAQTVWEPLAGNVAAILMAKLNEDQRRSTTMEHDADACVYLSLAREVRLLHCICEQRSRWLNCEEVVVAAAKLLCSAKSACSTFGHIELVGFGTSKSLNPVADIIASTPETSNQTCGNMEKNILILDPKHELRFCGSFREPIQATLKLSNPSDKRVCFKMRTTAPKMYGVRPTCGDLKPHSNQTVRVLLQPFHFNPNEQLKHKFLVQSTVVPLDMDDINYDKIWKSVEPADVMETKLKCVLEQSGGDFIQQPQTDVEISRRQYEAVRTVQRDENLAEELRKLKEENILLKKENVFLRHKDLRQQHASSTQTAPSLGKSESIEFSSVSPDMFADASMTSVFVMSIILLSVGFLIAKTIL
ncbi:vesicle-associated membrane protein/synaptobrevin-binding protein-like [Tropilaelaps mercedesae]|uniref:Vesicle-associated membrane protein/synaptobrevin-binding protein-like n=1 Tax=Tropilaelaps mercedesae TaxID=418985 RepID=A0A1V9XXJ1_9ACAR|nr:vesicle-associated membrane protein/synaptobrevin-binding protein-like [Tropilaelaps mercedesae]